MFKDIFGDFIQEKGLSLYKVSKETKIPKSIIYEWASGEREPVSEYIKILADYLNCSVDYLLGRTNVVSVNNIVELKEETPEENELLRIFRNASTKDRVMLMSYAYKIEDRNNLDIPELDLKAAKNDEVE